MHITPFSLYVSTVEPSLYMKKINGLNGTVGPQAETERLQLGSEPQQSGSVCCRGPHRRHPYISESGVSTARPCHC